MALCSNLCGGPLLSHQTTPCSTRLGDIRSIGFILCKEVFDKIAADPENPASWEDITDPALNVANANGTFVNDLQIERTSEISFVERFVSDGTAENSDGVTYTLSIISQNISCENNEFWKSLNGRSAYPVLFYNDGRMEISEVQFPFYTAMPSATKNTVQTYNIESSKKFPLGKNWICIENSPVLPGINF
jgi:hypothetical protein